MTQILKLELNDQIFTAIQQQAEAIGIPPEQLAAKLLEQWSSSLAEKQFGQVFKLSQSEAEKEAARAKFERNFGTLNLGSETNLDAARAKFERNFGTLNLGSETNLDNDSIDTDLVREYASTPEEGTYNTNCLNRLPYSDSCKGGCLNLCPSASTTTKALASSTSE